jgi:Arc/MetJ-type ribon-helix-helix transcriptional regulator
MPRPMTSLYLDEEQLKGIRQIVLELKNTVPYATQSSVIRFAVDAVIADWQKARRRKEIIEAVRQQQDRNHHK